MKTGICICLVALGVCAATACGARAETSDIVVTGAGSVVVMPDKARINILISASWSSSPRTSQTIRHFSGQSTLRSRRCRSGEGEFEFHRSRRTS